MGESRGSICPHNNKLFVLFRLYERVFEGNEGAAEEQENKSMPFFSPFTSFQAESLLVRRKVWRGNERGGGGGGGGGGGEDEEKGRECREISHNRKQNDTRLHIHAARLCA